MGVTTVHVELTVSVTVAQPIDHRISKVYGLILPYGSVVRTGICMHVCVGGSQREENVPKSLGLANQGRLACVGPVNRALKWPIINHRPVTSANSLKTWEHTMSPVYPTI